MTELIPDSIASRALREEMHATYSRTVIDDRGRQMSRQLFLLAVFLPAISVSSATQAGEEQCKSALVMESDATTSDDLLKQAILQISDEQTVQNVKKAIRLSAILPTQLGPLPLGFRA